MPSGSIRAYEMRGVWVYRFKSWGHNGYARLHQTAQTQALREASEASLMLLPPHSHDDNPMEHYFANIKCGHEYQPQTSIEQTVQMYQEF